MTSLAPAFSDVEARNDAFAQAHDIDEYYTRSSLLIRWIENQRLRAIERMAAMRNGERLLEVGCGGGHVLRLFPEGELTGVDVSERMIAKARENLRGRSVTLLKGQLHELELPPESYDCVICTEVLEHTVNPGVVLADIRRLLRPGGRAVITFPNDHLIHSVKRWLLLSGLVRLGLFGRVAWGGDEYHLHVWTVPQMRRLLATNFAIEREALVPARAFPIRCCFLLRPHTSHATPSHSYGALESSIQPYPA